MPSRIFLLILNGTILTVCAVFVSAERKLLLTALMLFLPLLDRHSFHLQTSIHKQQLIQWFSLVGLVCLLLIVEPAQLEIFFSILFLTALPEEWFFRHYLQNILVKYFNTSHTLKKSYSSHLAIVCTSVVFALMHLPLQGYIGLATFFPSLILGYAFQMKKDLIFVILLHSLFNLIFIIYLQPSILFL